MTYIDGKYVASRKFKQEVKDYSLKKALGDYLSSKDLRKIGFLNSDLIKIRNNKIVSKMKIKNIWYYSKQDILEFLKT